MKKKSLILIALCILTLILEILPYGAVCRFANPEGEPWHETYSYFDLTPFGYANFGPFCTALLTCAALILAIAYCFTNRSGIKNALLAVAVSAAIISLSPLLFGTAYYPPVAVMISVSLLALSAVSFLTRRD